MAKGQTGKDNVLKKIIQALGEDYIGEYDKKYYTWAQDDSDRIQVAITLTCPKIYRGVEETESGDYSWGETDTSVKKVSEPAQVTQKEQETLAELMAKLGL